ncbi:MAG: phage major tail protein, TP901-1 family [Alphaproteobacteria bacterium]|nr:MAG: phage major tail protein, TP901-1 family [Alphaproteobacteria bacterium]
MAAQLGKDLLLKRGDGGTPTENFTTVGGLRAKTISLNKEQVDVTDADSSGRWRELLAGGGVRTCEVSGEGVFKDTASEETVRADHFGDATGNYQILIPDFGTFTGPFEVSALEYAGEHTGEVTWSVTLMSAGAITFAAV